MLFHTVDNFNRPHPPQWAYDPLTEAFAFDLSFIGHRGGRRHVITVTSETLDDRWMTLITGPDQRGREGTSEVYDRFTSAVAELALRMVHGLSDNGREDDSLIALTIRVEQLLEREVKDFAMEIETNRRAGIEMDGVPDAVHSR